MKNSEIKDLVDFITENLPAKRLAQILSQNKDEEIYMVLNQNFITSTSKKQGFVRIIRDIRMKILNPLTNQKNTCRATYRYEIYNDDIVNYNTKLVFE